MYNNSEVWLDMETVCSLTTEIKETVRRKCKSGKYTSTSQMQGHSRVYKILLSSLPIAIQNKYLQLESVSNFDASKVTKDSEEYAKAPIWARKQADKYLYFQQTPAPHRAPGGPSRKVPLLSEVRGKMPVSLLRHDSPQSQEMESCALHRFPLLHRYRRQLLLHWTHCYHRHHRHIELHRFVLLL